MVGAEASRPKIIGLGDSSAPIGSSQDFAVETGIAPSVLMQESERMLWTMHRWLVAKNLPPK
jgi:streptogramin lyase